MRALKKDFAEAYALKKFSKSDCDAINRLVVDRIDFLVCPAHRMAYLLDPRFFGQTFSKEERGVAERDVMAWCGEMESKAAYTEISEFLSLCNREQAGSTISLWQALARPHSFGILLQISPCLKFCNAIIHASDQVLLQNGVFLLWGSCTLRAATAWRPLLSTSLCSSVLIM